MEITGQVKAVLELQQGTSKTSGKDWKKQTAVITVDAGGQYPNDIAFDMFNDKITELKVGETITAQIDIKSREYKGKWYSNINAWAIDKGDKNQPQAEQEVAQEPIAPEGAADGEKDDLPF